jgi:phytoene dehydrogenase-like protein
MQEVIVIGSGMGSLSAAAMLAEKGLKPLILEQNWIPGGCTTSYPRKGFVFEAGATTLVGLDEHMPLRYLLDQTGIELKTRKLDLPMQVHMPNGAVVNRFEKLEEWIKESEKHFGGDQQEFWRKAYGISQFVWNASTKYLHFPPSKPKDFWQLAKNAAPSDLLNARYALKSTDSFLNQSKLNSPDFRRFINEQLLITAQNHSEEVNFLFGAAALCYTNYGNYYIDGGLSNLVTPIVEYIEKQGGAIQYREPVLNIQKTKAGYTVKSKTRTYETKYLVSGIPFNNLIDIAPEIIPNKLIPSKMESKELYSAFQMGIAFKSSKQFESIHHQIHLENPLPITGSKSIFLSLSHEEDKTRSPETGVRIASISTHVKDPLHTIIDNEILEKIIIYELERRGFLNRKDILYSHSSGPKSWSKWTGRSYGFVGGYPQYMKIKPWQMLESRIDGLGAYQCGDTTYPGQGIPGATLSGIIASEKMLSDWF